MKLPVPIRVDAGISIPMHGLGRAAALCAIRLSNKAQRRDRRYFARAGIGQPLGIFSINH
jgi:hypothetical protein